MKEAVERTLVNLTEADFDTPVYRPLFDRSLRGAVAVGEDALVAPYFWDEPDRLIRRARFHAVCDGKFQLINLDDDWESGKNSGVMGNRKS